MARKRISEEDLLNFRKQAGELAKVVEEKYNRMDDERRVEVEPEPTGERGVMLIHDAACSAEQLAGFAEKLNGAGIIAECVNLNVGTPGSGMGKAPRWQVWLDAAQAGYQSLRDRCDKVMVLGTGLSAPLACVIAEQYTVDALAIVGGGLKKEGFSMAGGVRGTSFQLARLAKNNLFSIVCPVICFAPEDCSPYSADSANMYHIATRSENVQIEKIPGTSVSDIWTKCEDRIIKGILEFFDGE